MYLPAPFAEDHPALNRAVIAANPFGILVVAGDGRAEAEHIPFVLAEEPAPFGTLRFHLARANDAWRAFDGRTEALCVFRGPHGYVSPDWYATPGLVPTWNYVAVHARGRPVPLDDAALARLLEALSAQEEARLAPKPPWRSDRLTPQAYARLRRAVVGLEMPIEDLRGKWKLSQNRGEADAAAVAAALRRAGGETGAGLAALMESARRPPRG